MSRPLLLDLFCGAGGASTGYQRAGFDVVGVDINPQPNYPFEFHQADALDYLLENLRAFDAIHASPPCQHYSLVQYVNGDRRDEHPALLEPVRALLKLANRPYVIENVVGAPMKSPITLCGEMFGLAVIRHRLFESNLLLLQPSHPKHRGNTKQYRHGKLLDGPYFAVYGTGGERGSLDDWRTAMGMPWCQTKHEIAEAIPPAYTQFVGEQLINAVEAVA
jgi:DNA (cytosine-5)-methyltransferase 1